MTSIFYCIKHGDVILSKKDYPDNCDGSCKNCVFDKIGEVRNGEIFKDNDIKSFENYFELMNDGYEYRFLEILVRLNFKKISYL